MGPRRVAFLLCLLASPWAGGGEGEVRELVEQLRGGSAEAKQRLIAAGAPAIAPLFALLAEAGGTDAAWEARSALRWIAARAVEPKAPAGRREAVRDAVLPFLDAKQPAAVREAAIEMLGHVGTDLDVPRLADLLADEALARAAAAALSRIWGHAGKGALLDALDTAPPKLKAHLLELIATHGEADTLEVFAQAAEGGDQGVRVAAVKAIGVLGAPKGAPTLAEAIRRGPAGVKAAAFDSYLAIAAARLRAGDGRAARQLYENALNLAASDEQRAAALAGIGRVGDPASLPTLRPLLRSPSRRVRQGAYTALSRVRGPAGLQAVVAALPGAPGEAKPMLLSAIGDHRDASVSRLLLSCARDREEAVALAAVRALGQIGDASAAAPLLDVAEHARSEAVRAAALSIALRLAHGQADQGQGAAALPVFERAVRIAKDDAGRAEALRGLGKVGDARGLDLLRPILNDAKDMLRDEAVAACLAIGDAATSRGDREGAVNAFALVADAKPADALRREALQKLFALGVHYDLAARDGHITSWWVLGPFDCPDFNAAKQPQFPEREIQLKKAYQVAGRTLRWQLHHSTHRQGWIDLNALFKPNDKVLAYCYTELTVAREQAIEVHLGRDDGLTVWLNGKVLYDEHGPHGTGTEDFVVQARLAEGVNRILVKSSEGGGAWDFYLRLTDREGQPLGADAGRPR